MAKMRQFMTVHKDSDMDLKVVQSNWHKLAKVESATWVRTYFNEKEGVRYCIWLAKDKDVLIEIFDGFNMRYESIMPVEETIPDLWGKGWEKHLLEQNLL